MTPSTSRVAPRRLDPALLIIGAPFAVVFVLLAWRAAVVDWQPAQDFALFELRIGDVGTAHTPLVGAYSRFGWSHPGPLLFDVLAVPYRLLGSRPQAMLVGAVLINAAAVAGVLLLARRRGGTPMLLAGAAIAALLMHALGSDLLMSPWNPWIAVLPTAVLLLLAWSLAQRDWATLPATALIASFLVQTHVAFALLVALVLGAAATLAFVRPPSPRERASRRALVVTAVLLALVWAPVVIDQVAGTHNASRTVRYFATGQDAHAGFADGLGVTATEMMPIGPWVRGPEEVVPFSGEAPPSPTRQLALPLLALATSAAVTLKRRDRAGFALVVVASVAVGACVVSIARITGQVWPYLIRFTWAVAAVVWLAVGRALVPAAIALVEPRVPAAWRAKVTAPPGRVAAAAVTALVVLAVTLSLAPLDARPPDPIESENLARIVAAVDAAPVAALPGAGVVLVRPANIDILFPAPDSRGITAGLVAALRKRGVDARVVDGDWRFDSGLAGVQMFGDWRVDDGASPVAGTITIVDALTIDTYQPQAGEIELFRLDNPAEVAEIHQIEADLAREFTAAGHPEAIPLIAGEGVRWVGFNIPELGQFGAQTDRLLTLRGHRREAVFWRPSR